MNSHYSHPVRSSPVGSIAAVSPPCDSVDTGAAFEVPTPRARHFSDPVAAAQARYDAAFRRYHTTRAHGDLHRLRAANLARMAAYNEVAQ